MNSQIETRRDLLTHRTWLEASRLTISRDRDKMVLAIAGGALAVSVTFLEKIAAGPAGWLTLLLVVGWGFEVAAIVLILRSLHSSESALEHERERIDCMLSGDGKDPGWSNANARTTESLNSRASMLAVVGVGAILIYSAVSLIVQPKGSTPSINPTASQGVGGRS
jgi:hypothetical protein